MTLAEVYSQVGFLPAGGGLLAMGQQDQDSIARVEHDGGTDPGARPPVGSVGVILGFRRAHRQRAAALAGVVR